ncbi:MAG TPA: ATP-dependent DNA helicase [Acidimicrobiales bacterium]|nr:ATP-dependent DNA helicase [Acidimicrobiales bacterium]
MEAALHRVVAALGASEERPAQRTMASAVAGALRARRHLVVQAGTGTGKSLGYLVPALALGQRVVVTTATKALQDQLASRDLPLLEASLGVPFTWAVLKGRSNYLCRQRAREVAGGGDQLPVGTAVAHVGGGGTPGTGPDADADALQLGLDGSAPMQLPPRPTTGDRAKAAKAVAPDDGLGTLGREVKRLLAWGDRAETGDRAELAWEPSPTAWAQVSVGVRDCPGKAKCPSGDECFAEAARERASQADVVVVNTHLYATHLAAGGAVLPAHDAVIVDEAHELEDIASASLGFELTAGRLAALARSARPLVIPADAGAVDAVDTSAVVVTEVLARFGGTQLPRPLPADDATRLTVVRERVASLGAAVRRAGSATGTGGGGADLDTPRRQRALQAAGHLATDLDAVLSLGDDKVAWVEGPSHAPVLRVAPIDVGATLGRLLWDDHEAPTAVLASATIPPGLPARIGLPAGSWDALDVGSPFDYADQALLYCALHLPEPRQAGWEGAMTDELVRLIEAAGGRTMALFTSWRGMQAAAEAVRDRVPFEVLTQSDLPKPALVERFAAHEQSCLFATMGFWQGVDVPGPALSLVVIDKLPFPRPDDPLLQARRDRLGRGAFMAIDVPRAATLLAQGAGRLIRSAGDRGVVAVLDKRLGTARYRWDLLDALPPMRRTRSFDEVVDFLRPIRQPRAQ